MLKKIVAMDSEKSPEKGKRSHARRGSTVSNASDTSSRGSRFSLSGTAKAIGLGRRSGSQASLSKAAVGSISKPKMKAEDERKLTLAQIAGEASNTNLKPVDGDEADATFEPRLLPLLKPTLPPPYKGIATITAENKSERAGELSVASGTQVHLYERESNGYVYIKLVTENDDGESGWVPKSIATLTKAETSS